MTDQGLIARLLDAETDLADCAVDCIEELDAHIKELTLQLLAAHGQAADALDKLAKAVEALELIAGVKGPYSRPFPEAHEGYGAFAVVKSREALNELEGEKK